jgi:tetratricopeptide (TPR) repeat protein
MQLTDEDDAEVLDAVLAEAVPPNAARAAALLERAVKAGRQDAQVVYLLALAYKRQGKTAEAHAALRRIPQPDADAFLQMGLLSLRENQVARAEEELARAWQMDPSSYEICYNLLLTRLTLGRIAAANELMPAAISQASQRGDAAEQRFLSVLHGLLRNAEVDGDPRFDPLLGDLTPADEKRLLAVARDLGHLDAAVGLLKTFSVARPSSAAVRDAYVEVVLVKAKELMDRCAWTEAEILLRPLAKETAVPRAHRVALLNLLGCCACLTMDSGAAARHFAEAAKLAGGDARLHQNLALTYELEGDLPRADPHWNRFFDLLGPRTPGPPDVHDYPEALAFQGLRRLADRYRDKENWNQALAYVQRARDLRPQDPETLEQLFHLFNQAKKPGEARAILERLRSLRPQDPQLELYELDLVEVKNLNDIERLLTDIDRILKRYPGDARVEERAVTMVGNVIPLMGNLCDQLTEQMSKVIDQVRHLPNYQINWSAVREVMRDLMKEFQKLRRITGKCLPLVKSDEHRRIVRDLADHIDKKMEACRSMMG